MTTPAAPGPGPEPAPVTAATAPADVLDTPEAGRRVMVGGAVRLVGYGIGLIASVIAAAVVIRYMGKDDYGRFSTVLALVTSLQIVTDLGITSLGVREYAQRTGDDRERFMRVLLGMRLVTLTLLLVASMGAGLVLGWDDQMLAGALLVGLAGGITGVTGTIGIPLAAEIRMGVVTGIDVARQVGTGVAYVLLAATGAGIVAFFGSAVPVALFVLFATFFFVRGAVPLRPIIDPRAWSDLLAPTLTFALASAAGSLYVYGAMVLTEVVATQDETSLFGAAFRVYVIVSTFPVLLVTTAFPVLSRAARDDHERLRYAGQRLVEGTALLAGAALIGLVLGAEPIILALGDREFIDATPVLRIQGVALALTFVLATFGFALLALHRHRAMILCNLAALATSGSTVVLLADAHGAVGASIGVLLGETVLLTGYLVALRTGPEPVRYTAGRAVRAVPPLALALCCWFLPVGAILQTILALVIYAAGLVALRAIPDEIAAALPGPLGRVLGAGR